MTGTDKAPRSDTDQVESAPDGSGVRIGRLVAVDQLGAPSVEFGGSPEGGPVVAQTTVSLSENDVGARVTLAFEEGRVSAPIVMGVLRDPLEEWVVESPAREPDAEVDGERLVIEAEQEVVLRCGDASITLRRDGRVLIRGSHLVSRSSGPNRVRGASVHIN